MNTSTKKQQIAYTNAYSKFILNKQKTNNNTKKQHFNHSNWYKNFNTQSSNNKSTIDVDKGWIIFFDSPIDNKRYYFSKMYETLHRPKFSTKHIAMFDDVVAVSDSLKVLEDTIKIYGPGIPKHQHLKKLKLMAAHATIEKPKPS